MWILLIPSVEDIFPTFHSSFHGCASHQLLSPISRLLLIVYVPRNFIFRGCSDVGETSCVYELGSRRWNWKFREKAWEKQDTELLLHSTCFSRNFQLHRRDPSTNLFASKRRNDNWWPFHIFKRSSSPCSIFSLSNKIFSHPSLETCCQSTLLTSLSICTRCQITWILTQSTNVLDFI